MKTTQFREIFPIVDFSDKYTFDQCVTVRDFLIQVVEIYQQDKELRIQQACLSVYMAFRDHYPSYLQYLDQEQIEQ